MPQSFKIYLIILCFLGCNGNKSYFEGGKGTADGSPEVGSLILKGEVVNAVSNEPIEGASIKGNSIPLSSVDETREDGRFQIEGLEPGKYSFEISKKGFVGETIEVEINQAVNTMRAVLSPSLSDGQIRIILTWEEEPRDLDSHLQGTIEGEEQYNIYFNAREFDNANLDVDDTNRLGPETITINSVAGTYEYKVHNYSGDPVYGLGENEISLADSGAKVTVLYDDKRKVFSPGENAEGNLWQPFSLTIDEAGAVNIENKDSWSEEEPFEGFLDNVRGVFPRVGRGN